MYRHLQAEVANIAATLSEVETRLSELKMIDPTTPTPLEERGAMMIIVISFIGIALVGFAIGLKSGAQAGFD